MYGLAIIIIVGIYCFFAITCIIFSKKKFLTLVFFILIPTWDIIPKRLFFIFKCLNNDIKINSFADSRGLFEKDPYDFHDFQFPFEDKRSESEKEKGLDMLVWTFLMHPLRGYLIKNGLYLEIEWKYFDRELNKYINRKGRFWITESGSPYCLKNITSEDLYKFHRREFPAKDTGKCIAGYPIENIEAKYVLDEVVSRNTGLFGVDEETTVIYDRETKKELASANIIYLRHNWVLGLLDPGGVADSCGLWRACASKKIAKLFFENAINSKKPFHYIPPEESTFCSDSLDLLFE